MILEKSESRKTKYKALLWLRIDQRCAFIASEAGGYSADVLGINEKRMVEVEVKTNLEDVKNDFRKHKHHCYFKTGDDTIDFTREDRWIPNQFYFAVPGYLVESTKAMIDKKGYTPYGIIDATDWKVIKRAGWLHKRPPGSDVKFILALRMGSELLRFHEAML